MFSKLFPAKAKDDPPMFLIVGLGNPGDEYAKNRHNVGFMAVDALAGDYGFPAWKSKFSGHLSEGRIDGIKIILLKPQTFMNLSGQSVAAAAKFYKIPPANIIAFFDELDLEPAKVRHKFGGGNAGHNGLKSMEAHLGTASFQRIRIGIGHPGHKDRVTGHVLGNFAKSDQIWLEPLLAALSKYAPDLVQGRENDYMSKVAMDIAPEKKVKKSKADE